MWIHPVAGAIAKRVILSRAACKRRLLSNPGLKYKNGPLPTDYDGEQVLSENVLSITIVDSGTSLKKNKIPKDALASCL